MNVRRFCPVLALLVTLGALCACGSGANKDKLSGGLGPGAGGPPVGMVTPSNIDRPDGTLIGGFSYDGAFFCIAPSATGACELVTVTDPTEIGVLIYPYPGSGPPQIQIVMTHISGRADTPCRFSAATQARDGGFAIGDTGFRTNADDQQLYQVNLSRSGTYATLFCANLLDNTGAQFSIVADSPDKVSWLQVYEVINSIHAE